jgi:hypothetical protein
MFLSPRYSGACKILFGRHAAWVLFGLLLGFLAWERNPELPVNRPPLPSAVSSTRLVANYGKLPLSFEVNEGQTDQAVKFLSRGNGYGLFLTADEAVLRLNRPSMVSGQSSVGKKQKPGVRSQEAGANGRPPTTDHGPRTTDSILRLKLVGANANADVTGAEQLPGKVNYFLGNDPSKWRTNVPTYAKVKYQRVYSGIDLVYYGNQDGQLEYDFVVAPGADPTAIRFKLSGALEVGSKQSAVGSGTHNQTQRQSPIQNLKLQIDPSGDVVIYGDGGEVRFHRPVVYQTKSPANRRSSIDNRQLLEGHYVVMASNQIRFALGAYDRTKALVIDPVLSYSTYLGGSSEDSGNGIAVDSSGNAYVIGTTSSVDFPTVPGAIQQTLRGASNAFVGKLNPTGSTLVYSTYLGGSHTDVGAFGIAVDGSGNAYVTGKTSSSDFPTTPGAFQQALKGTSNAFVTKLNPTGSALLYSTYLGGSSNDGGADIAVDSSGNAYVTGGTDSIDFPATPGAFQTTFGGNRDAFATKLNATGSGLVYSTYLGGSDEDFGTSITVDELGSAYLAGLAGSVDFPTTPGAFQTTSPGSGFVTKISPSGSALVYSTYLGSPTMGGTTSPGGIALDGLGNVYVTGLTSAPDFPTTAGAFQQVLRGSGNVYVSKLNPTGSALVYSTFLGGTNFDSGQSVAVDTSGNAYITGGTTSSDFPTVNPLQATLRGNENPFVTRLNPAGSALVYSTYLGGSGGDEGDGIAVDSSGNVYVIGVTASTDFPTVNPLQANNAGGDDAFVAKLSTAPAAAGLNPSSLSFGNVLVNVTSPEQNLILSDSGDAPLDLTSITASGDFALVTTGSSCPYGGGTMEPGAPCNIYVVFTPTATGNRTGTVTITDNAANSPQTVSLSGTGLLSAPSISPVSLTFNNQLVGTTSASQPVIVTNTGPLALNLTSLAISSGWTQTNNCSPSIAPNAACTINVSFQPTSFGPLTGTLTLTDYALGSPQAVALSGTGIGAGANLSTASLTFPSQQVGTTSGSQSVTLQNTGNQTLSIASISPAGPDGGDFGLSQNCGASLAAGGTCQINVTFTPTARGTRTAGVTLVDNAANSPQTISLTGTGTGPTAELSSNSVTFAGQFVGTTGLPQNITLTNNGDLALTISGLQASAQFGTSNGCTSSLAVGVSCTISVFFDPSAAGAQTGTLTVADNAAGSPQTVQLLGTGMDFGMSSSTMSTIVLVGQTANYNVMVTPKGGLNQTVNLTCSGAPALSTCTITPSLVALNGAASAPVTVSVTTTAGTMAPPRSKVLPPTLLGIARRLWLGVLLMVASFAALTGARKRPAAYALGLCLVMMMLWSACDVVGGGAHTPGTPAGTYPLVVTATVTSAATSTQLTHTLNLSLTVN